MSRNFGIVTGSASVGGNQMPSPHFAHDTQRDLPPLPRGSITSGSILEGGQIGEPSLDERELSASLLFLAVVLAPLLFVGLTVVGYLTFIA